MAKYPEWEYELLRYLGTPAPLSNDGMDAQFPNSLLALNLWAQSEGSVTNNALATSGRGAGATTCVAQCGSSSPIYEYDNVADGVAQMGRFLQGSFYTKIVSALVGNADLGAIYQAINSSPWCKGCQSGQYPVDLAKAAGGGSAGISGSVGTGSSSGGAGAGGSGASPQGKDLSQCKFSGPSFDFLFFKASTCLMSQGQWKAISGAVALATGVVVAGFGIVLLASAVGKSTGATAAVGKAVSALPGPAGKIIKGTGAAGSGSTSPARSAPAIRPPATPSTDSGPPLNRRENRQAERTIREEGIGPRGGNPTSQRVAASHRRGTSVPGARRPAAHQRRAINTTPNTTDRNGMPF